MSQTNPQYPGATSVANPVITNALERKFGGSNVIWPIVLIEDDQTTGYLYERTSQNTTNAYTDNRPQSKSGLPTYFLDYTAEPRTVIPHSTSLEPLVAPNYQCSYDYILDNSLFATVDLDYVWRVESHNVV